jgi:hypothetical protein
MDELLKPSDFGFEDVGGQPAPDTGFVSPSDMGFEAVSPQTGAPVQTPQELGYYPEELEAAKNAMLKQRGDQRTWGQTASDTAANIRDAISYMAPTALGGRGEFMISQLPGQVYQAGKEAVEAPRKLMTGEVPMFDAQGNVRPEAVAESMKFTGVVGPGSVVRKGMSMPETAARRRIANAIAEDIETGKIRGLDPTRRTQFGPRVQSGATPTELASLAAEGVPVSAYDLSAGPSVRGLVEEAATKAPDRAPAVQIGQQMAERARDTGTYIASTIDNIAGKPIATGDEFQAAIDLIKKTNDPAYKRVMSLPEHQSVFSPEIKNLLESRPVFAKVIKERAEGAINRGEMPPPIYGARGELNIQPFNAPSLEYLDQVYRGVRNKASIAYDAGDSEIGKDYKEAANALRAELDKVAARDPAGNSVYKAIRDDASEVFGARNALEAGYKFAKTADPLKLREVQQAYSRYSPTQKEQFRVGLLANIKDAALSNQVNKVTSWFDGSNPKMYEKIESILGPDATLRLGNQIQLQKIVNEGVAPVVQEAAPTPGGRGRIGLPTAFGVGAGIAVGGEKLLQNLPQVANVIQHPITIGTATTIGAAGTLYAAKKLIGAAKNAYEARVSEEILKAISSNDPRTFAALERHPPKLVRTVLDRLSNMTQRAAIAGAGEAGDTEEAGFEIVPRQERKSGGRVKTNPISAEVKRVRALLSQKTANMLSLPDDAIATALDLAKRT